MAERDDLEARLAALFPNGVPREYSPVNVGADVLEIVTSDTPPGTVFFVSPRQRQAMIEAGLDVSNVEETKPIPVAHENGNTPPDYLGVIESSNRRTTQEMLEAYRDAPWMRAAVVAREVERDLVLFGEHVRDANGERVDPRTIHNIEINGLDAAQIADAVQREADRRGETLAGRAITGHRARLEVSRDGETWEPIERLSFDVVPDEEPGEMSAELRDVERDADGNITRARIASVSPALAAIAPLPANGAALGTLFGQPFFASTTIIPVVIDPAEAAARRKKLADEAAAYEKQRREMMAEWPIALIELYEALVRQPPGPVRPLISRQYGRIVRAIPARKLGEPEVDPRCVWCDEDAVLIVDATQHGSNGEPMHLACWAEAEMAEQFRYEEDRGFGDGGAELRDVVSYHAHDRAGHEEDLQARRYLDENPTATLNDYRLVRRLRSSWQRREVERRQRERTASMTSYSAPYQFARPEWAPDTRANLDHNYRVRRARGDFGPAGGTLVPPEIADEVIGLLYASHVVIGMPPLHTPESPRFDVVADADQTHPLDRIRRWLGDDTSTSPPEEGPEPDDPAFDPMKDS